jgi:Fe-S-cluster containining protein
MKIISEVSPLKQLKAIYQLYDREIDAYCSVQPEENSDERFCLACEKGCAACCTCNVTMTRLEAAYLVESCTADQQAVLKKRLNDQLTAQHYIPKLSLNRFARFCMEGKKILQEENNPDWGRCCLLEKEACSYYASRPFGCRALLSTRNCRTTGTAEQPSFFLSLNHLFLQYIEHLDQDGFSGNLSDLLKWMLNIGSNFKKNLPDSDLEKRLFVSNEAISVLMVPPKHRALIRPVAEKLNRIVAGHL